MTSQFKKGDIVIGAKRRRDQSFHPIIYFGEIDGNFFEGGMITHSQRGGNVRLEDSHFAKKIDTDPTTELFRAKLFNKETRMGSIQKDRNALR